MVGGMSADDGSGLLAFEAGFTAPKLVRIAPPVFVHHRRRQFLRVKSNTHAGARGSQLVKWKEIRFTKGKPDISLGSASSLIGFFSIWRLDAPQSRESNTANHLHTPSH